MRRFSLLLATVAVSITVFGQASQNQDRLRWWREARFGMFIHWGLYAIPAGEWKGKQIPGLGEWIMNHAKIPVAEYEQLANQFNPVKFNADEWVQIAKSAGQKYMVITAKHHDGFAMWHSRVSKYNVYDATPFHRDPIAELAEACRRNGMPLGFYYSQTQDWHEPNGIGNTWDFDESKKDFDKYFQAKAIPQVRELLTNYGPVALIWFDTPRQITPEQSKQLVDLVHTLQPKCLVDGRIGNNMGDYRSTGDNEIPVKVLDYDWETPVTTNDTWGFKKNDSNWKSSQTLIRQLVDVVSKNGNYLLNVGPTAEGVIPEPAVERLRQVGSWLKVNGDAVYGAKPSPYPYEFEWGSMTEKPGRLFLEIVNWPKDGVFELFGLSSRVQRAYALANQNAPVKVTQHEIDGRQDLRLNLPAQPLDSNASVIALEVDGLPQAYQGLVQQPDGKVTLNCAFAHLDTGTHIKVSNRGVTSGWLDVSEKLEWDFDLYRSGNYEIIARTTPARGAAEPSQSNGGDEIQVSVGGQNVKHSIENEGMVADPRNPLTPDVRTRLGQISLEAGKQRLSVQALKIDTQSKVGLRLREIELIPVNEH